jgi:hypothetical protein
VVLKGKLLESFSTCMITLNNALNILTISHELVCLTGVRRGENLLPFLSCISFIILEQYFTDLYGYSLESVLKKVNLN